VNSFVMADPRLCDGCQTCMEACVEVHQQAGLQARPRLYVMQTAQGSMPVQCHQCMNGPCAAICPVGAITQKGDAVHLDEKRCIGCKMCAIVCPFGAISPYGDSFTSQAAGLAPVASTGAAAKHNVVAKCDLCSFRAEGPACIGACPNGALRLIRDIEVERTLADRRRGSAAVLEVSARP